MPMNITDKFKVLIGKDPWGNSIKIAIVNYRDGKMFAAQPVELTFKEIPAGEEFDPTFKICGIFKEEFLRAWAEALDEKDVKTDKDAKIQGTLEATRYHLEDLRRMLKIK